MLNQFAERIGETLGTAAGRADSIKARGADLIAETKDAAMASQEALGEFGEDAREQGAAAKKSVKRLVARGKAVVRKARAAVSRNVTPARKTGARRVAKRTIARKSARAVVRRAAPKAKAVVKKVRKAVKTAGKSAARGMSRAKVQVRKLKGRGKKRR